MPKDALLAVAFTDLNGNDKYNVGKDDLIAALVDTNNDNTVSIGDTVVFGTYPAIPDGSNSGTGGIFTGPDTTVENVSVATSTFISVDTASGVVQWLADSNVELFQTRDPTDLATESLLVDNINNPGLDVIKTDLTVQGPGMPNTSLNVTGSQPGDQGFLDVLIFTSGHDLL
jgi:hypothetical protein